MQSWSGRGPCIFCLFRNGAISSIRRLPKPNGDPIQPRRLYASKTTEPRHRPRDKPQVRVRRLPIRSGQQEKGPGIFRAEQHISQKKQDDEDSPLTNFPARVKSVLNTLKANLQNNFTEDEPKLSQLAALDPKGDIWATFATSVLELSKGGSKNKMTPFESKLYRQLVEANSAYEYRQDLTRALHFGFIDLVLNVSHTRDPSVTSSVADMRYPTEWYTEARANQRTIHLHVGPTNSGKTYNALKRLEESKNGFYAGPLRLLAHEVYSRLRAKGLRCDLITGDDVRRDTDGAAKMYASTVEMVDVSQPAEVAVIDEIQMMASEDRGWAWTRALLGANATEVHLCGETRVVPLIREFAASMGDTLHIHKYERLSPLKVMSRSLRGNLQQLRKGDCVVSFSIIGIHTLKKQIELDTGRRVAIVYGSLPSEIRAQQAALFNDPDNDYDYLVASDAIGMGLNLNIKRIIFETVHKFNGVTREQLSVPQIKQIAGRAGRFRSAYQDMKSQDNTALPLSESKTPTDKKPISIGLVTCLDEADLPIIKSALETEAPPIKSAGILPPANLIDQFVARLPKGIPFEYVLTRLCNQATLHPRFMLCSIRDQTSIAKVIESVPRLTAGQRYLICAAPARFRTPEGQSILQAYARCIAEKSPASIADIAEVPLELLDTKPSGDKMYLERLESLHQALILFLWLSYRFVNIFLDQEMAVYAKGLVEEKINTCLLEFSANPKLRNRLLALRRNSKMDVKNVRNENKVDHVEEKLVEDDAIDQKDKEEHGHEDSGRTNVARDRVALPVDWLKGDPIMEGDVETFAKGQHVSM